MTSTSKLALASITEVRGQLKRKVYRLIAELGERGMTCDEAEHRLDMRHQTVSARFHDLHREGWIYRTKRRRRTRSGRSAVVYRARRIRRVVILPAKCPTCGK
jgi:predicted transcriptional regulator